MNLPIRATTAIPSGRYFWAYPWIMALLIAANLAVWAGGGGEPKLTGLTINLRWPAYTRSTPPGESPLPVGYTSPTSSEANLAQARVEPAPSPNFDLLYSPPYPSLDSLEPMSQPRVEEASQPSLATPIPPASSPGLEAPKPVGVPASVVVQPQETQPAPAAAPVKATLQEATLSANSPPSPSAPALAPAVELSPLEQDMLQRLNSERARFGLVPLTIDGGLVAVARERSQSMASLNYFSHTAPDGQTAFTLLSAREIAYRYAGENLARNNYPSDASAGVAMEGFMNSGTHRANILGAHYETVGIGLAATADGMKYFTLVFLGVNL